MQFLELLTILALAVLSFGMPTPNDSSNKPSEDENPGPHRRGVSYNDPKYVHFFDSPDSKVTWMYNWDSRDGGSSGMWYEYVAMLWDDKSDHTNGWFANVDHWVNAGPGTTHLLAFNEPDMCKSGAGGACMSLQQSLDGWHTWMEPLRKHGSKVMLGSPAVTNQGGDKGLQYLKNFLKGCSGCQVDFINIHWYDKADNIQYFKDHVNEAISIAGQRPVWITEFGFGDSSEDQIKDFLKEVLPWLDQQSSVHRYCMTMAAPASLINNDGTGLSAIGQVYNTV